MCAILTLVLLLSFAAAVPDVDYSVIEQDDACTEDTEEGSCSVELRQLRANSAAIKRHLAAENCADISGAYIRSSDNALLKATQTGCSAVFSCLNCTEETQVGLPQWKGPR